MNIAYRRILLFLICLTLLVLPTVFWGGLYMVGGDDTRLYYIFPQEMYRNYAQNIVSNNSLGVNGGYASVSFFIPFLLLVSFVKFLLPIFNAQMVLYGLNFIFGFIFFYKFLGLWVEKDKGTTYVFLAKITSSLFYLFSFFVLKTVYSHQLISVYVISTFPIVIFFFLKSLHEKRIYYAILASVLYSAFSATILSLPWFGALVFTNIPICLLWMKRSFRRTLWSIFIFLAIFVCLNFYWLFHQLFPVFVHTGGSAIQLYTSNIFKLNNINLIKALAYLNPPIHQVAAYLRTSWTDRYNLRFDQSYGLTYIITILLAGIVMPKKDKKIGGTYILAVTGLLMGFMLITPNFGDWNVNLFIFFNNTIPLFAIFRNMFDKFGVAVSFQFSFALFISLIILGSKFRSSILRGILLFVLTGITLWNAHTYLFSNKSSVGISGVFNQDYLALTKYIASMNEPSRFVWLPLNFSSYSAIEDGLNPGHFYYGCSPLQFLTRASDYAGFQSFVTAADPDLNYQMIGFLQEKQYDKIAKVLQRMNARYVINYHYDITKEYYDHMNFEGTIDQQKDGMFEMLAGEKIKDFGTRYSLYTINEKYRSEKIFVTSTFDEFPNSFSDVSFKKISPSQFDIAVTNPLETLHLAFLETFDSLWELRAVDNDGIEHAIPNVQHEMVYRYGNGWMIMLDELRNSSPAVFQTDTSGKEILHLRIIFRAQQYSNMANIASIILWGIMFVYLVIVGGFMWYTKQKYENK